MENIQYLDIRDHLPPKPATQSTGRYPSVNGLKRSYSYYQSDQQRIPFRPVQSKFHQEARHSHSKPFQVRPTLSLTVDDVEEDESDVVYRGVPRRIGSITKAKVGMSATVTVSPKTDIVFPPTPGLTPDRASIAAASYMQRCPTTPPSLIPDMPSVTSMASPSPIVCPMAPPTPDTTTCLIPHNPRALERLLPATSQQKAIKLGSPSSSVPPRREASATRCRPAAKCALRYIAGKGFGVRSTTNIKKGETIIVEKPFFRLPTAIQDADEDGLILPFWDQLGDKAKIKVLSFMSKRDDHDINALGRGDHGVALNDFIHDIVHNNGIPLETDPNEDPEETGMFEIIGRVNHSCTPNSVWRWNKAANRLYLVAYIDIPKNREITASYLNDLCLSSNKRQADLFEQFAFRCSCSACTRPAAEIEVSDKNLATYTSLERKWDLPGDSWLYEDWISDYSRAMRVLREAKGILESEGKYHAMGDLLEEIWILCVSHGKKREAIAAGKEMQEHYAISRGREDAGGDWDETVINPEKCANWKEAVMWDDDSPRGRSSRKGKP